MLDDDTMRAWSILLRYLAVVANDEHGLILALAEFQYLVQSETDFPSLLQKLWNTD
ncbi:MAG: hypothetical protein KKA73_11620 [Chloroflexi bacterium]|nr:hypothetical protein [Chloroflexota bacterium]MBU1748327.1 hypothetical protein [Chloroflexota bacterium]